MSAGSQWRNLHVCGPGLSEVGGRAERSKDVFRFGMDAFQSQGLAVPMAMADENGQQRMKERIGGGGESSSGVFARGHLRSSNRFLFFF